MEENFNDYLDNENEYQSNNYLANDKEENVKLIKPKISEDKKSKDSLINILQNLEKDLILNNSCKKEFNLKNNFEDNCIKTEVFGSPCCYICFSSNKNSLSIKLFYCSHCNKLFCKQCLSNHYEFNFKDIKQSYIKYIDNNSNEEIIDKSIPEKAGFCWVFIYIILISFFNFIYLLPIFAMKPVMSSLEIIILNYVKKIFTYKVENPNSLFNFYDIFYNELNALNLDFDLMMIMNWLGNTVLRSCGFIITTILFIVVNSVYFIISYNFDFIKYNENNKYTIWQFLLLLLCYIIIFIGIGSSSLLSQTTFLEFFKEYRLWLKKKKDDNLTNNNEEMKNISNDKENNKLLNSINNDDNIIQKNNLGNDTKKLKRKKSYRELKLEKERTKIKKTKLGAFFLITLITFLSFFLNFYINLKILNYRNKNREEINKNYNNETLLISEYINDLNKTRELYESDKKLFFKIYLIYYIVCMIASLILYYVIQSRCLKEKDEKNTEKNSDNTDHLLKDYKGKNGHQNVEPTLIKEIKDDKSTQSYSICKCCGFFYYSLETNFRGKYNCFLRFLYCLKDFFIINCKSLFDCCNITVCQVINAIFCYGEDKCNCECNCCCDKINYDKQDEKFCFCYQEKRKLKWFHDYITSDTQKDIAPYIIEYFLLGLIIITFQKKFAGFRIELHEHDYDFSIFDEDGLSVLDAIKIIEIFNDWELLISIIFSLIVFFFLTRQLSKKELGKSINKKGKDFFKTYSIFNAIHILLLISSIISLIFSILYHFGINDFGNTIIIPILMYHYYSFSLNYYCICVTEQENTHEFFFSGNVLISIYLYIWNIIYSLIQDYSKNEKYTFYFQGALSIVIIVFISMFLIFSRLKYNICYNCININLCGFLSAFGPCCIYNTYCVNGTQICDCCCCDEDSCCFSEKCQDYYYCCSCCRCFSEKKELTFNN